MAQTSRFQVAGMYKSEKKEGVKALKQSIPGISSVEFVGDKIVEFKHSTTTTTDQIKAALEAPHLKPTLKSYTTP